MIRSIKNRLLRMQQAVCLFLNSYASGASRKLMSQASRRSAS